MATTFDNSLRLVKPGELVVSIADIFDKLDKKLTADEKQQLLIAILSRKQGQVSPGDLITADLVNQILATLGDLETRILRLESQQPIANTDVEIQRILPSGPLTVGQEIAIEGKNFDFTVGGAFVSFGKKSVFSFRTGSRDDRLITEVPNLSDLPDEGAQVPLTVANRASSDFRMVTVLPAAISLDGSSVLVTAGTVDPNPPQNLKDALFPYSITSTAPTDVTFAIQVLVGGPGEQPSATEYDHLVSILNRDRQVLPNRKLKLAANATEQIFVKLGQLPFESDFAIVTVASARGVASVDSGIRRYMVGTQDTNDDLLTLDAVSFEPSDIVFGGVVGLESGKNLKVSLTLKLSAKAAAQQVSSVTCDFDLKLDGGNGWTLRLLDPSPIAGETTKASNIEIKSNAPRIVNFAISARPNPSISGSALLTITRNGQAAGNVKAKTLALVLQVKPKPL